MKIILRGINVGLWIIHINAKTGEGELYTDETMRRLLGVADDITPGECFKHWQNNIDKEYRVAVDNMIHDMAESNTVIQVEYHGVIRKVIRLLSVAREDVLRKMMKLSFSKVSTV